VIAVPGLSPTSPLITDGPVLVTVVPPSTAKLAAVPRPTGASAAAALFPPTKVQAMPMATATKRTMDDGERRTVMVDLPSRGDIRATGVQGRTGLNCPESARSYTRGQGPFTARRRWSRTSSTWLAACIFAHPRVRRAGPGRGDRSLRARSAGAWLRPLAQIGQPAHMQPAADVGAQCCVLCAENSAADRGEDPWAVAQLSTGIVRLNPTQWFRGADVLRGADVRRRVAPATTIDPCYSPHGDVGRC
jgi:hypothetical protein